MKQLITTCLIAFLSLSTAIVQAQMVVSDPANLAQNVTTVVNQGKQIAQQIQEIQNQITQIQLMRRDLESLTSGDWATLQDSFRRLDALYAQAEQISMSWASVASEYDQVYRSFDPTQHDLTDYDEFRSRWQEQTNNAIRTAMVSHGVVDEYERRSTNLEELLSASDSSAGTLSALQAGNQMAAILNRQMMELNEVIIADSRARLSYLREEQARREASAARARDRMLRNYGGEPVDMQIPNSLPRFR